MSLQISTFEDLVAAGKLPSGNSFELVPDITDNIVAVSEVDEKQLWRKKARQAAISLSMVAGHDLSDMKHRLATDFVADMMDVDVHFASMAWMAANNGMVIKVAAGAINCPSCNAPWREIPFGHLHVHHRLEPVSGQIYDVQLPPESLPPTLKSGQLCLMDPTWRAARSGLPEAHWTNADVIKIQRQLAALRVKVDTGVRMPGKAEVGQIRSAGLRALEEQMDQFMPHFADTFTITCNSCGQESELPFALGI